MTKFANIFKKNWAYVVVGIMGANACVAIISFQRLKALADQGLTEKRLSDFDVSLHGTLLLWQLSLLLSTGLLLVLFWLWRRNAQAQAEAAEVLAESEERFRAFVDNSPMVSYLKDAQGRLWWVNKNFRDTAPGVGVGDNFSEVDSAMKLQGDLARQQRDSIEAAVLQGENREYVAEAKGMDGRIHYWRMLKFPVKIRGETLIGCKAQDITDKHEAALELERSNRELQDFASIAAHDLQEPLRKIRAFDDLLNDELKGTLQATAADYLQRMQASAGRMQALIEDLLSYSRLNSQVAAYVTVDLNQVLSEVLADLELAISQGGMKVQSDTLPSIQADASQMRQLFQNLLANAVKFRREGEAPKMQISAAAHGDRVEIRFQDNGIGFDMRFADKIFAIFQRLHGRDKYEGNGVGLSVCRKIVERHGGTIRAESQPGLGSTFVVSLKSMQAEV